MLQTRNPAAPGMAMTMCGMDCIIERMTSGSTHMRIDWPAKALPLSVARKALVSRS